MQDEEVEAETHLEFPFLLAFQLYPRSVEILAKEASLSRRWGKFCTSVYDGCTVPEKVAELTLQPLSRRKLTRIKFSASTA